MVLVSHKIQCYLSHVSEDNSVSFVQNELKFGRGSVHTLHLYKFQLILNKTSYHQFADTHLNSMWVYVHTPKQACLQDWHQISPRVDQNSLFY